jgi:hypothetical protein
VPRRIAWRGAPSIRNLTGSPAGRPTKLCRVLPELEAIAYPRRRYERLVGRLLDELPCRGRKRRLRRVGEDFGRELAAAAGLSPAPSRRAGLELLCRAATAEGFQDDAAILGQLRVAAIRRAAACVEKSA